MKKNRLPVYLFIFIIGVAAFTLYGRMETQEYSNDRVKSYYHEMRTAIKDLLNNAPIEEIEKEKMLTRKQKEVLVESSSRIYSSYTEIKAIGTTFKGVSPEPTDTERTLEHIYLTFDQLNPSNKKVQQLTGDQVNHIKDVYRFLTEVHNVNMFEMIGPRFGGMGQTQSTIFEFNDFQGGDNGVKKLWLIGLIYLLTACSQADGTREQNENKLPEDQPVAERVTGERVAEKLEIPWSITKKDKVFFISERNGTVVSIDSQSGEKDRVPVNLKKQLHTEGEGGLLGFELVPGSNIEAWAYHTYEEDEGVFNRLIRLRLEQGQWKETETLLERIPGGAIHNGGRVKLGPDQMLYITTGDAANPELAQEADTLAGKILRLNIDGSIPSDNPDPDSPVYSYGHRNPQGLAWSEDGQLFASEHGQSAHDEINRIDKGKNYGWPVIQGDQQGAGMETPLFHTNGETWAPSGMAYHDDKLYIATLRGEAVRTFDIRNSETEIFLRGNGRIRDVLIEGNTLYYITNNTDGRGTPRENDDQLIKVELK